MEWFVENIVYICPILFFVAGFVLGRMSKKPQTKIKYRTRPSKILAKSVTYHYN